MQLPTATHEEGLVKSLSRSPEGVAELALDDDRRHALACHVDGVRVPELVRSETSAHTRCGDSAARSARAAALDQCRPVPNADDAEERPDGQLDSELEQGLEFVPARRVHSELAPAAALAAPDQQRAAAVIETGIGECERLLDAEPGPPEDHDQPAQPAVMDAVTGGAHDMDRLPK